MIKNDYKPNKLSNPIFSQKKTISRAPIIMAVTAIALVSWGISQSFTDETEQGQVALDNASVSSELGQPAQLQSDLVETERAEQKRRFTIDLNLDSNSTNRSSNITTRPVEGSSKVASINNSSIDANSARTNITLELDSDTDIALAANEESSIKWQTSRIKSGDSTARVFQRHKLSATDLHNIMQVGKPTQTLERIQAGHVFEYGLNNDGSLAGIRYHIDRLNKLEVLNINGKWQAEIHTKDVEIRQASATGIITSSLFLAGKDAGLSDSLVMELAGIFGWDIDFILDIRSGDRFTVIYEEKYVDGDKYTNGNILAAEFVNQGKSYQAVRYTDSKGNTEYFSDKGLSMRKAFLRAPLDFSYVSSSFNPKRFHPVLKRVKPHRGIDYAAPIGTPVKAAGDGKVIQSGYDKYNGHHVFIQHGQKYTTKYLHFTKRKVRTGQRVKQGQVIGYLGRSGMVTGAHLHYEFLVNGVHRNPKTVKLPDAAPVRKSERDRFYRKSGPILKQLQTRSMNAQIQLAEAE